MVPPAAVTSPLPLLPPLHPTSAVVEPPAVKVTGWVMVTLPVEEQPLLSLTVKVYVPAVAVMLDVVALLLHE